MERIFITGVGTACSIGSSYAEVGRALGEGRSGIVPTRFPQEYKAERFGLFAPVVDFNTREESPEDWTGPNGFSLPMEVMRSIPPSGLYAFWAVQNALKEAGLEPQDVTDGKTGLYSASAGSSKMMYQHLKRMYERGVMASSPLGVLSSVVGTLNFHLAAFYKITGPTCGFASACASSGHALGFAFDTLRAEGAERMIVLGAEDDTPETILPFAPMRALAQGASLDDFHGPFDAKRNGFVGTGGAVAMILERESVAKKRGARPLAIMEGWGQATDGYHPAKPHPEGTGLLEAMKNALRQAGRQASEIDYINAHATGTPLGDAAEVKALEALYPEGSPHISSTKGQTGHGLSLASVLESAIVIWALRSQCVPGTSGLKELDGICKKLSIQVAAQPLEMKVGMTNSSGFGGANVSIIFSKA